MSKHRDIPSHETLECEFKSDRKRLPDSEIIDTIVALSNSDGGILYLGVEDDGVPTGVNHAHEDTTRLAAFIANKTVPPVSVRTSTLMLDEHGCFDSKGLQVVAIEVPKSIAIVASSDGKIMRRRLKADGSPESVPLYPYEIITRLTTLGQLDYSAFPVPDTSLDDFDPIELARLRNILARSNGSDRALLELSDSELLAALRMTATVDGKTVPTVTGILLAGKMDTIERAIPTATATFQVLEGTEVKINQDFQQPLLYTIEAMGDMFNPWNPSREYEDGLFRVSVPEFDRRAFREALVNAFGHRDYAALGPVRVLIDDEGLTISNPGGFVEGINVDNLLTAEPHGRNECLMNTLKRVGLAEKTGRGIDRIYEGSLVYGRPLPDYHDSTSAMVRVFIARSAPDESFMKMLSEEQKRTGKPLSIRSLIALDALRKQRRLTLPTLTEQMHITEAAARATLENLVETGLVEAYGSGASRSYTLSARMYSRAGKAADFVRQSDIDTVRYPELVLKLARQQGGSVATREVESLLHVSRRQAYRVLRQLMDESKLKRVGSGRNIHYKLI